MRRPFLIGKKLYLRSLEESDINDEYLNWLNDSEVTRYMETGRFPSTPKKLYEYLNCLKEYPDDIIFAIIDEKTDKHIGNVTLNHVNWIHRTADTGLMIGQKDFWGKGYAFEAWSLVIDYAFGRLGLRKIVAGVVVGNESSIAVLKKFGFKIEGTFRKELFVDGEYRDTVRLGLLREEFHMG